MKFRCRMLLPKETAWFEIEARSWTEAVTDLHTYSMYSDGLHFFAYADENPQGDGFLEINFALMEAEGHGDVVSRVYHSGIRRKGGVRPHRPSLPMRLKEIADKLGWTKDPMLLIEPGWEDESEKWESKSTSKKFEKAV